MASAATVIPMTFSRQVAVDTERVPVGAATVTPGGLLGLLLGARGGFCDALFEELAKRSPKELIAVIRSGRAPESRLTFAAEILGRDVPTAEAADVLRDVLRFHASALVREGAVLGLEHHLQRIGVREALLRAAKTDPSPGVRRAANEALEED